MKKPKKILSIIGTRPEAIKMAPVVLELQKHVDLIESVVCVTGQHRDMLDPILELFNIVPDYDLNLMRHNQQLTALTADLLNALQKVIDKEKPDWIIAQGDTTTVLGAALSAYYNRIKFGHVEAGLRTGDMYAPFPEEGNRILADSLATRMWCPTSLNRSILLKEGKKDSETHITGNTVIDALQFISSMKYDWERGPLSKFKDSEKLILVTAHRRENHGEGIKNICVALKKLAEKYKEIEFIYPVHLNPNIQEPVQQHLSNIKNIHLITPLNYFDLVHLMKKSYLLLTDSGGIQEEGPALKKPVLVMRNTTERPEGVDAGVSKLVGTSIETIVAGVENLLENEKAYIEMASGINPYGDGHAAEKIVNDILAQK